MKRPIVAGVVLLWTLLPLLLLIYCYVRMAEAYDFLDSESYRGALRNAEVAEQNVRQAEQVASSNEDTDLQLTQYRLTIAQNKLRGLGAESLSYYEVTRFGWEATLYRDNWISRSVIWLVNSTHVSEEYAVAAPLIIAGLIIYGSQVLFFAYRRRRVKNELVMA